MKERWSKFSQALLEGDERAAFEIISDKSLSSLEVYQDIITPAMYDVGEKWLRNEITVADEHLATSVCDFALAQYVYQFKKHKTHTSPKAMFLCLEEEQHVIGSKMAAALFEEYHWQVRHLGASLPLEHAIASIQKWKPSIIGISAAIPYRIPALKRAITELENLDWKPEIIVGGRLTGMHNLHPYCGEQTTVVYDLEQVTEYLSERNNEEVSSDGVR